MSLLAELKRRKVFRVAVQYGVVSFVVLQAADIVFPRLGLPDWTVTLIVAVAVAGLPIALVLAWAFEMTPGGVSRTEPAASGELEAIRQQRQAGWTAGLVALAATLLLFAGGWWVLQRASRTAAAPVAASADATAESYGSIAVLPFVNLSDDPKNEYFADGLADELINALAGIEGLRVAARTSAFAFKGEEVDVREIGDALDVAVVLEGSVRKSGDRVRVAAQLIDASDGFHIWSAVYDRLLTDIFAVQDEISRAIVTALAIPLGTAEVENLYRGGTEDVEAYESYLLGRQRWATRQVRALREAVALFEDAIARDSSFALAWSGLADAIDALAWRDPSAAHLVPRGMAAARHAIELAPDLAEAHASLGVLASDFDRDWETAERELRAAIRLKPSYASARQWLGNLLRSLGRVREAVEQHRIAVELDPLSAAMSNSYGFTLAAAHRWGEAAQQWQRTERLLDPVPSSYLAQVVHGSHLGLDVGALAAKAERWAALRGYADPAEARVIGLAVLDRSSAGQAVPVLEKMEAAGLSLRELADLAAAIGEAELAITYLERAFAAGDPTLTGIGIDPALDGLRSHSQFIRIIDALDLPNGYDPEADR